jgi:hypothetical protein
MQGKRTPSCYEPVLLLDPEMDRATSLASLINDILGSRSTGLRYGDSFSWASLEAARREHPLFDGAQVCTAVNLRTVR